MIKSFDELCDAFDVSREAYPNNLRLLQKTLYKNTACGMYLEPTLGANKHDPTGVVIGSIVEGSDQGTESYSLLFPFELSEFNNIIGRIEDEAEEIFDGIKNEDEF